MPEPLLVHETGRFVGGFAAVFVCASLVIRVALVLLALSDRHRGAVVTIDRLLVGVDRVALIALALVIWWAWLAGELATAPTVAVWHA